MENKDNELNEGLINFDIKLNQQNQKIVGKANEIFDNFPNDESKNDKNREMLNKPIPIFTKHNLYIYLLMGKFAKIRNIISDKNLKYRIYSNPDNYQESPILIKNNIANMNKEINFKIYVPSFLERIVIEIYDEE